MISMSVDMREFDAAFREYMKLTSKTLAEAIARKGTDLAFAAIKKTEKQEASKIREIFFARGRNKPRKRYDKPRSKYPAGHKRSGPKFGPLAYAIARKYDPSAIGGDLDKMTKVLVANRVRSIAFARSGWLKAARKLKDVAAKYAIKISGSSKGGAKEFGKGDATFSNTGGMSPVAEIINESYTKQDAPNFATGKTASSTNKGAGIKAAERGLQAAIPVVVADMEKYIAMKLQRAADRHNAK